MLGRLLAEEDGAGLAGSGLRGARGPPVRGGTDRTKRAFQTDKQAGSWDTMSDAMNPGSDGEDGECQLAMMQ